MREQLEKELKQAQAHVTQLQRQLDTLDDFPIGTILMLQDQYYLNYAIKMESITRDSGYFKKSETPVWALIFFDFSGQSYPSLGELIADRGCKSYQIIYRPDSQ